MPSFGALRVVSRPFGSRCCSTSASTSCWQREESFLGQQGEINSGNSVVRKDSTSPNLRRRRKVASEIGDRSESFGQTSQSGQLAQVLTTTTSTTHKSIPKHTLLRSDALLAQFLKLVQNPWKRSNVRKATRIGQHQIRCIVKWNRIRAYGQCPASQMTTAVDAGCPFMAKMTITVGVNFMVSSQ
jgi:hypothetical protein